MDVLRWGGVALVALGLGYACLVAFGAWKWAYSSGKLVDSLSASVRPDNGAIYSAADIADLPEPVRRYFERALPDGQRIVRSAEFSMQGNFNMSLSAQQWRQFTSVQHITTGPPGFVWDARITMFPGVPVRVTDSYIAGRGKLHPALLGLFSVGDLEGDGEIARAELMRWFAEAVWYPTALLPSQGVTWEAVDADAASARATMTDGPLSLTLLFRFGPDGLIASVHADARSATLDGVEMMLPWDCRLSDYQTRSGMRVPMTGEVLYQTPQGERSYFRGRVTRIDHAFHD